LIFRFDKEENFYVDALYNTVTDKSFHLNGIKRINIRDFGLERPITMLGMIRVSEWIDIEIITDFDVNKIQDTASR